MIRNLENIFKKIQENILLKFEELEGTCTNEKSLDSWIRKEGGGGKTAVIANGNFFDNCAVNYSSIVGKKLPEAALKNKKNYQMVNFQPWEYQ